MEDRSNNDIFEVSEMALNLIHDAVLKAVADAVLKSVAIERLSAFLPHSISETVSKRTR